MRTRTTERTGLMYGFAAYGMWGLLPLYWHALKDTGAAEVLSQRMVWSLPTALVILVLLRRWSWIPALVRQPKKLGLVLLAAVVITVNWGLFIWSVAADRVLESSLGYFINPLVSIAFGVLILRERLRPAQWVAVGVGALSVVVMTFAYGKLPWLSLCLALSFATYGLIKKRIKLDGVEGFSAETAVQFLPALGFLIFLGVRGDSTFTADGVAHTLLLVFSGLATALPLIFFGGAAVRLPLSTIGLLQYMAPAFMFVLGVTVFHEEMPPERWAGFALVWAALCLLTWDALRKAHRGHVELREATAAAAQARAQEERDAAEGQDATVERDTPDGPAPVSPR
ncbi:EamA family transporter RarD [Streptomyces iconiensis]|uniref:EamA family transporter RarD n=1 Tax=Streptomyces iconiensis TaxID=1384038 RepID=A0ABT6ZXC7_9ACTN|nr:EamA family transporter RarD [Streptomyces iconiensis]MDJ1133729.1 EamA family transporter RarD [Streptomyces iconiensis]